MNQLNMSYNAPYRPHLIEDTAAIVVQDGDGAQALVIFHVEKEITTTHPLAMVFWDGKSTPTVMKMSDDYETVEEWCSERGYALMAVFAEYKDFTLTYSVTGEKNG